MKKFLRFNRKKSAVLALFTAAVLLSASCAASPEKVKLYLSPSDFGSEAYFEACKTRFESKYPQYKIYERAYSYSDETILPKLLTGQLPTLFTMPYASAASAAENGYILDLSSYSEVVDAFQKTQEDVRAFLTNETSVYGLPSSRSALGMLLNLNMLEDAGVLERDSSGELRLYDEAGKPLYPATFAQVEAAAQKLKQHYGTSRYALFLPSADWESGRIFCNLVYNFGGENLETQDEEGNYRVSLQTRAVGNALRWIKYMSQNGYIDDSEAYGIADWAIQAENGEAAMLFCESGAVLEAMRGGLYEGQFAFVPLPAAVEGGEKALWDGELFAVNGKADKKQAEGALKFLRFLGKFPSCDETALSGLEYEFSFLKEAGAPVLSGFGVWDDASYESTYESVYSAYQTAPESYFERYFKNFNAIKREEEPYRKKELYAMLARLERTMLFRPNDSELVTILQNEEKAFNEANQK